MGIEPGPRYPQSGVSNDFANVSDLVAVVTRHSGAGEMHAKARTGNRGGKRVPQAQDPSREARTFSQELTFEPDFPLKIQQT